MRTREEGTAHARAAGARRAGRDQSGWGRRGVRGTLALPAPPADISVDLPALLARIDEVIAQRACRPTAS